MAKKKDKTQKLTLLLMRDSVKSPKDALRSPGTLKNVTVRGDAHFKGEFWYARPATRKPNWLTFVGPALSSLPTGLIASSVSAVLFVKAGGRLFALTLGYGRNLLKQDSFVLGFGLKAALNRIDHRKIRSLDLKNYEDLVVSTRRQTSRNSDLGTFGLDVSKDLLRAVTGEPEDQKFAKRVTGADACALSVAMTAGGLGRKCEQLLNAWKDDKYKAHFEWIDHLSEVRESSRVEALNAKVVEALRSNDTDMLHLAPAETIEWQDVDGFRINGTRTIEYDDLDLDEYLSNLGDKRDELSIEKLRSNRVWVRWTGSADFQSRWTLFNCLVWETTLDGRLYALVEGKWFEVEKSFSRRVRKFVRDIPTPETSLPSAYVGEHEEDYNERVATSADIVCLDQNLVKPTDAATKIEFCDLLSKHKQFIHVKKKTRSATLSHLFAQGTVAAREFLQDAGVRDQVIQHLKAKTGKSGFVSLIPAGTKRPVASDYEVAYAVVAKPNANWPGSLPFFSQLNLMQHAKLLQGLGFRVTLQLVEEK